MNIFVRENKVKGNKTRWDGWDGEKGSSTLLDNLPLTQVHQRHECHASYSNLPGEGEVTLSLSLSLSFGIGIGIDG